MVITINKDTKPEEITRELEKLKKPQNNQGLAEYYGKLKGAFGDGMEYQKKLRENTLL